MRSKQIKTQTAASLLIIAGLFSNCKNEEKPATSANEVVMAPLEVGTKTADYEVISAKELKLSPGVKIQRFKTANGNNGFMILRANGGLGGYMVCECSGSTSGNCTTTNDNPESATCEGGCNDSEGNPRGCSLLGPLEGPPRSPFTIKVVDKKEYEKGIIDRYK